MNWAEKARSGVLSESKRIKLGRISILPMFDRLTKVGVLVAAVGTDGGINCSANVRDHGDINIAIKQFHSGLMKSC